MDQQEKLKQIPLITMLFAAGITAVISIFAEITFGVFLLRIFIASILFYVIGSVVQILFTYAIKKSNDGGESEEKASDNGSDEIGSEGYSDEDEEEESEF